MNTIPQETRSPFDPSGLRLGTPWLTTRSMKEPQMKQIAAWINQVMNISAHLAAPAEASGEGRDFKDFEAKVAASPEIAAIAAEVKTLCLKFPLQIRAEEKTLIRT